MNFNTFLKKYSVIVAILLGLILTRGISFCFFAVSIHYPQANQQFINDSFHHYYIGIVLVIISLLLRKYKKWSLLAAFGLGIILEESAVVLDDLGLKGFRFYYLNWWDFVLTLIGLFVIILIFKEFKQRWLSNKK